MFNSFNIKKMYSIYNKFLLIVILIILIIMSILIVVSAQIIFYGSQRRVPIGHPLNNFSQKKNELWNVSIWTDGSSFSFNCPLNIMVKINRTSCNSLEKPNNISCLFVLTKKQERKTYEKKIDIKDLFISSEGKYAKNLYSSKAEDVFNHDAGIIITNFYISIIDPFFVQLLKEDKEFYSEGEFQITLYLEINSNSKFVFLLNFDKNFSIIKNNSGPVSRWEKA